MQTWEQQAAIAVYSKVQAFIRVGMQGGQSVHVNAEQGGRFISEAWNVQVYRHLPSPKPGYVADWDVLPEWQRQADMDIFADIQAEVVREVQQVS